MEQLDLFPDERIKEYKIEVKWEEQVEKKKELIVKVPPLENDDELEDYLIEEIWEMLYDDGISPDMIDWKFLQ